MAKRRDWEGIMVRFIASDRKTRRIKMSSPKCAQVQAWRLKKDWVFQGSCVDIRTSGSTIIIEKG